MLCLLYKYCLQCYVCSTNIAYNDAFLVHILPNVLIIFYLDWTSPRGRIMLQDEDNNYNNGKDEDYKKLNTLMDYHVTDGSKVYMTERQMASALNISTSGLDRSDLSSRYG